MLATGVVAAPERKVAAAPPNWSEARVKALPALASAPATLAMHLRELGPALFDDNLAIARKHFSLPLLVDQLRALFDAHAWPHD